MAVKTLLDRTRKAKQGSYWKSSETSSCTVAHLPLDGTRRGEWHDFSECFYCTSFGAAVSSNGGDVTNYWLYDKPTLRNYILGPGKCIHCCNFSSPKNVLHRSSHAEVAKVEMLKGEVVRKPREEGWFEQRFYEFFGWLLITPFPQEMKFSIFNGKVLSIYDI